MKKQHVLFVLYLLNFSQSNADIYKAIDVDGRTYYTDEPKNSPLMPKNIPYKPIARTMSLDNSTTVEFNNKKQVDATPREVSYEQAKVDLEKSMQKFYEHQESMLNRAFLPSENGHFTGTHEKYAENGKKVSEVSYKDGKQNGLATWWRSGGQKERERHYIDGKLNGLQTEFDADGQKMIETNYKDGKEDGLITIWKNGHKVQEENYKDGKRDGLMIGWDENGKMDSESNWKDGKENGLSTVWLENGHKVSTYYEDGKEIDLDVIEMKKIKNRCKTQMGEHGFAIVKACADQDIEALHSIQNGLYMDKHEAITTRCLKQMNGHGWVMVKACADQDIEAENALRKY